MILTKRSVLLVPKYGTSDICARSRRYLANQRYPLPPPSPPPPPPLPRASHAPPPRTSPPPSPPLPRDVMSCHDVKRLLQLTAVVTSLLCLTALGGIDFPHEWMKCVKLCDRMFFGCVLDVETLHEECVWERIGCRGNCDRQFLDDKKQMKRTVEQKCPRIII